MPAERVAMRRVREILRLHHQHELGCKRIAGRCNVSNNTVLRCLQRAEAAGFGWPLPDGLDDAQLEAMPYAKARPSSKRPEPDWRSVQREFQHRGMTCRQVWLEYREVHPDGYNHSWFCERLRNRSGGAEPSMHQSHNAGEGMFADYAGMPLPIINPDTGQIHDSQVFVGALGGSDLYIAEATASQQ